MKSVKLRGILCVVAASVCYGITPMLSNAALRGGLPAEFLIGIFGKAPLFMVESSDNAMTNESFVGFSMLIACILSLFTCLFTKKSIAVQKKQAWQLAMFGGGCFTATGLLISYAYLCIPAGTTIVLHFTYPIAVAAASAIFLKQRFTPVKLIALLSAVVGIALISGFTGGGALSGKPALGMPLALLSGITYAAYFLAGRHASYSSVEGSVSNFYITGASALICFVVALCTGRFDLPGSLFMWIILIGEGVIGYMIGIRLLLCGIRLLGSVEASALNTLEPVFASLTSMAVFGESMGVLKITGAVLVLSAAAVSILAMKDTPKLDSN